MLLPIIFRSNTGNKGFPFSLLKAEVLLRWTIYRYSVPCECPGLSRKQRAAVWLLVSPTTSALKLRVGIEAPLLQFRISYLFGNPEPGVHVSKYRLRELYRLWPAWSVGAMFCVVTHPEQQNKFPQPKVHVRCGGLGLPGCGAYSEPFSVLPSIKTNLLCLIVKANEQNKTNNESTTITCNLLQLLCCNGCALVCWDLHLPLAVSTPPLSYWSSADEHP